MGKSGKDLTTAIRLAIKLYDNGLSLHRAAKLQGISQGALLQALARRDREKRAWPKECEACGFRCKDRPCVWPGGMCGWLDERRRGLK